MKTNRDLSCLVLVIAIAGNAVAAEPGDTEGSALAEIVVTAQNAKFAA